MLPTSGLRDGVSRLFREAAASLFSTVFPGDCRLCGQTLTNISRLPVCETCLHGIVSLKGTYCAVCGEQVFVFTQGDGGKGDSPAICGMCRRATPPFTRAAAFGSYDGNLRGLLHLLKYEQVKPAADYLGRHLAQAIQKLWPMFADVSPLVVPVPLHSGKGRQRGFNQTELIARAALKHLSTQGLRLEMSRRLLKRQRATSSQTGLTRHQRRANVRGAFAVRNRRAIVGRDILVVDDVFTTGTTVSECARLLARAGARRVFVATVARVLKGEAARIQQSPAGRVAMAAAS